MKDPLQYKPTPYDILEINPTGIIDKKTVESHFKKHFHEKRARESRKILNNPLDRAVVDIFFYEEIYFKKMLGKIFNNPSYLLTKREKIAKDWEANQKKFFPYYPITHILAVFWFWWAVFEEEKIWDETGELIQIAPSLDKISFQKKTLWENAIVNWVSVINSEEYIEQWIGLKKKSGLDLDPKTSIDNVKDKIESFIFGYFKKFSERYRLKNDLEMSQQFQDYEQLFLSEMKSAKNICRIEYKRNVSGEDYKFCCGRILLEKTGFLEEIKNYVDEQLKKSQDNYKLKKFSLGLSPYFSIRSLVDESKYDKALEAIKKISLKDQEDEEIINIKSICLFEKGKQFFSTGNLKQAFTFWEDGFILGKNPKKRKEEIITLCKEKAVSLQKSSPDKAIEILETAIETIPDKELNKTLSVIYLDRGIKNMNNALQKIPPANSANDRIEVSQNEFNEIIEKLSTVKKSIKREAEKAISDMIKAVSIDPENLNAKEQLDIAKNNISDIELLDIYKAIELKNNDYALDKINDLIKEGSINPKVKELQIALRSSYCWFCKNRKVPNPGDEHSYIEIKMFKETQRDILNVKWDILSIKIPRCKECKEVHEKKSSGFGIGCITGLVLSIIVMTIFKNFNALYFIIVNITLTLGGVMIETILNSDKLTHTAGINTKMNFPMIKDKIKEGWNIGERPPDVRGTPNRTSGVNQ